MSGKRSTMYMAIKNFFHNEAKLGKEDVDQHLIKIIMEQIDNISDTHIKHVIESALSKRAELIAREIERKVDKHVREAVRQSLSNATISIEASVVKRAPEHFARLLDLGE